MGFLDTPQPQKLSIEKTLYDGKTAWRYTCVDNTKCDRKKSGSCNGVIVLVQEERPKSKDDIKQCFYAMPKKDLEW